MLRKKKFDYTFNDLKNALQELELKEGDNLFIHSNVGFFGVLQNANSAEDYYNIFKTAIFDVISKQGTLVMPTFTYSFCWNQVYDKNVSPSLCGLLAEQMRMDPEAIRSEDANFSIIAIGKLAEEFTQDPPEYSFGPNSFWEKFLNNDGIFVNFNFDAGSTFIHYVERTLQVPYRWDKPFPGTSIINGEPREGLFYHYVYDLENPDHEPNFPKFHKKAVEEGLVKKVNLGRGQIISITSRDTFNLIRKVIKKDPSFLIGKL
jgi:aminoglycoside 3-N-acetyltransferase